MRVITYLGFTLLSILIQFSVMEYIQGKISSVEKQIDNNVTSQKKIFHEVLNSLKRKPHALYYQTNLNNNMNLMKLAPSAEAYSNISILESEITTVTSNTLFDEFYDDNISTTEDTFTTEAMYTTTEIDNITEISFFDKKNQTAVTEKRQMKSLRNKNCKCDLLYQICDINCCCDSDCSESQIKLFACKDLNIQEEISHLCYPFQRSRQYQEINFFDNLFCIVKTNLPDKRITNRKKYDITAVKQSYMWHNYKVTRHTDFQRKPYTYGDTVWILKEESIWYIDIPVPVINNYCSGRKPILFLKEESIKCEVDMKDLEMLQILKTSQNASCISVTEKSANSSVLNCSTLHCTNWTVIVCDKDGENCNEYNKTLHEPLCTESYCKNIAFRLDYTFYYLDSRITNASITFYVQTIPSHITLMTQEINVKFLLTNVSSNKIVKMSGNPGYIYGLPILLSTNDKNHSMHFFNTTFKEKRYLSLPTNKDSICMRTNSTHDYIKFGINKRIKCKFVYSGPVLTQNSTNACDDVERDLKKIFELTEKAYVAPLGNPIDLKDSDWLTVKNNFIEKELTYGQFLAKNTRLRCYNLVTRISYVFTFADVSENLNRREDKIISVDVVVATSNVTFHADDVSTMLTIDTSFIDGTKPKAYEYAGGPHLNIHLPKDFFFPFLSNGFHVNELNLLLLMLCVIMLNKMTLQY